MSKQEEQDYRFAETLGHMLTKIEEVMEQHSKLAEEVKELEALKRHIAEKLIKGV